MNSSKRPSKFLLTVLVMIGILVLALDSDTLNKPTVDENYTPSEEITGIRIENGSSDVVFKTGDRFRVEGKNLIKGSYSFTTEDNILVVKTFKGANSFLNFSLFSLATKITITIPKGCIFDEVNVKCGSGEVAIHELEADNVKLTVGSGNIDFDRISCDTISMTVGSGDLEFGELQSDNCNAVVGSGDFIGKELNVETMQAEVGSGDLELEGVIDGNSNFLCGSGDIELHLHGDFKEYSFELDGKDIEINGKEYERHYKSRELREKNMELHCGSGDIEVKIR